MITSELAYFDASAREGVWPIEREKISLLGRSARLLAEISSPEVASALIQHGKFTFERLDKTVKSNLAIIFGTKDEALAKAKTVNQAHLLHANKDNENTYRVNDPVLKGTVFMMKTLMSIRTHEELVEPLTEQQKDAYVNGIKQYGRVFGVNKEYISETYQALLDLYHQHLESGKIAVGDDAKLIRDKLLNPLKNPVESADYLIRYLSIDGRVSENIAPLLIKLFAVKLTKIHEIFTKNILLRELSDEYGFMNSNPDTILYKGLSRSIKQVLPAIPSAKRFHSEYLRFQS